MEILKTREIERGDRSIGLAEQQYGAIHSFLEYDLKVNTESESPVEIARIIEERVKGELA